MNAPEIFAAIVADPVLIHRHRPSGDCNVRCHVVEAGDLSALLASSAQA